MLRKMVPIALVVAILALVYFGVWSKGPISSDETQTGFGKGSVESTGSLSPVSHPVYQPVSRGPAVLPNGTPVSSKASSGVSNVAKPSRGAQLIAAYVAANDRGELQASFLAGHLVGATKDSRSFSEFLVQLAYRAGEYHRFGVSQQARKLYEIAYTGEDEFLAADTLLFHEFTISKNFASLYWKWLTSLTLPVSAESRGIHHITRPSVGLEVGRSFFSNRLTVSVQPNVSYYFNQWATDDSGTPLRKVALGQQVQAEVSLIPGRLSLVGWGKGFYQVYEQFDHNSDRPESTTSYDYGTYFSLNFNRTVSTQLGYVRGNSLLKDARHNLNFYDAPTSRFYASLQISL